VGRTGAGRYWLIWAAIAPIVAWVIVRGFGVERGYPLDPLMAFTPYAAVAAFLAAGIALALRNWAAALVVALALIWFVALLAPRMIGSDEEPRRGDVVIGVVSANVHQGAANAGALVGLVERHHADLLAVPELTQSFDRRLRRAGIRRRLPHTALSKGSGAGGGGIYSSFPLTRLPGERPGVFRMPRARIELPRGRTIRMVAVHPPPPRSDTTERWSRGLRSLPTSGAGQLWVLAGDFNATLDQVELRRVVDRGYRDAGEVTGNGLIPTWPATVHHLPPITIDHILADRRIRILSYEVDDLPGSDHHAIYAQLAVPPRATG
jgi:endonuclease/exonuclease/phosphatase (EEP) superfamily protein YafD